MRFENKVVLVTGSSTGIGKTTAIEFAKEGASVVINCFSSPEKGRNTAREITDSGGKAEFIQADVSKESQVNKMFEEIIRNYGRLDALVNNAGFAKQSSFFDLTVPAFQKTLDVNLIGTFLCSKYAARQMVKQGSGSIVSVASIRGLENCARKDLIDYSIAKAGVINLTKSLAKELTPYGINVNAVAPAITRTELVKNLSEQAKQKAVGGCLLKRMAEPIEIAKSILFLSSSDASYITGEVLVIDGGYNLTAL